MNFLKFVLRLSEPVGNVEVELLAAHAAAGDRAAGVAVDDASVDGSEEGSLSNIVALVDLDIVLAQKVIATTLNNCSHLLTILVVDLHGRPAVRTPAGESGAELA